MEIKRWLEADLHGGRPQPTLHPGVGRVLRYVRNHLQDPDALSLSALAVVAGLSPSRLMHAFTTSIGIALRPYLLWLRLQLAGGELIRGASATQAALQAGFADAARPESYLPTYAWNYAIGDCREQGTMQYSIRHFPQPRAPGANDM